jgi:hypothetical protein
MRDLIQLDGAVQKPARLDLPPVGQDRSGGKPWEQRWLDTAIILGFFAALYWPLALGGGLLVILLMIIKCG